MLVPRAIRTLPRGTFSLRSFSTTAAAATGPPVESYISHSTDPFFNLALEGHLFRTRPTDRALCLIYRNAPCVVLGRNQNPWKELNASAMRAAQIPMVRRQSGGGTVYHDLGNLNFSFHVAREQFDRRTHAELVVRALNGAPIGLASSQTGMTHREGAYVNARGDICIRVRPSFPRPVGPLDPAPAEWQERKVSGSAYKLVSSRAYHHGTLLLAASLSSLGASLHNSRGDALVSKGVASVRARVANLATAFPDRTDQLEYLPVAEAVVEEFWKTYTDGAYRAESSRVAETLLDNPEPDQGRWKLREAYEELRSWDWVWGQTPEFTHRIAFPGNSRAAASTRFTAEIHSKNGIILDTKLEDLEVGDLQREREVRSTLEGLKGQRYDEYALAPPWAQDLEGRSQARLSPRNETEAEIFAWLREVL